MLMRAPDSRIQLFGIPITAGYDLVWGVDFDFIVRKVWGSI